MLHSFQSNFLIILILISFAIYIVLLIISKCIMNYKLNQMVTLLNDKRFSEFDQMMEKKIIKIVFNPFNIDFIKLNSYLIRKDTNKIDNAFSHFDSVRLSSKQRDEVDLKAFNYYLCNDEKKAKKYYQNIQKSKTNPMKQDVERLYDIYIRKSDRYLQTLLKETETLEDQYKSANELLISEIYKNLGDINKQLEYKELAEKHLDIK